MNKESRKVMASLAHRHYGRHSFIKATELPGKLTDYVTKIPRARDDGTIYSVDAIADEKLILKHLPTNFLPQEPEKILLIADSTGVSETTNFRSWAKYFDCYSLSIAEEE